MEAAVQPGTTHLERARLATLHIFAGGLGAAGKRRLTGVHGAETPKGHVSRWLLLVQAGAMQFERGSHALVSLPNEGQLWALGGGQPQRQLNSVEVLCILLHLPPSAPASPTGHPMKLPARTHACQVMSTGTALL